MDAPDFRAPKDTPAVDRGYFRGAVELMAKQKGLTYAQAHDILSGRDAGDVVECNTSYRESADRPGSDGGEEWFDVPAVT